MPSALSLPPISLTTWTMTPVADADPDDEPCIKCNDPKDGAGGRQMILCDSPVCDNAAHLDCLGLRTVPAGDWFCCDVCQRAAGAHVRIIPLASVQPAAHPSPADSTFDAAMSAQRFQHLDIELCLSTGSPAEEQPPAHLC